VDRFEDFSHRIHRTQPSPGNDRAHLALPPGDNGAPFVGLDRSEPVARDVGSLLYDIRERLDARLPRADDKDFLLLKQRINGDKKSDPPTGRLALDAQGGTAPEAEIRIQTAEGFHGHVRRIWVRPIDPAFDASQLAVTITLHGVALNVAGVCFERPPVLDLNDELVLNVANQGAAPVAIEYAVEGWLRRKE